MSQQTVDPAGRHASWRGAVLQLVDGRNERSPLDGIIRRTALVNRLRAARTYPVVMLVAPEGYGKTTLLEQWAMRDDRTFVWLPSDRAAPAVFLTRACASTEGSEVVAVVDDAHSLDEATLSELAELTRAAGATLVLSGRTEPRLSAPSFSLLRSRGTLFELGSHDLALTTGETKAILRMLGAPVDSVDAAEVVEETDGWPAAVQLAARKGGYDHLRSACLAMLTPERRSFLRRTSVLDRLSRALCEAVLGALDAPPDREWTEALSPFLVPLDHHGEWFRHRRPYVHLFRAELEATEPQLVSVLHERAATWYRDHGDPYSAIAHAQVAGDVERFAALFAASALQTHNRGNIAAVEDWLQRLDDASLRGRPEAATLAARLYAHYGHTSDAARCLATAERCLGDAEGSFEGDATTARIALVRTATGHMRLCEAPAEVQSALEGMHTTDPWRPYGLLLQGMAEALVGDSESADRTLDCAVHVSELLRATETRALALTERALLADARGSQDDAEGYIERALETNDRLDGFPSHALTLAVSARFQLRHANWSDAQQALAAARLLLPRLTDAMPWLSVQTRLELAAAHLMLLDTAAADEMLAEADCLLESTGDVAMLAARRAELQAERNSLSSAALKPNTRLTAAELRLLPLLTTHLSFREIGAHFYLSQHTVKTQAISAYRKLGATSRGEAVQRAEELGLIDVATERSRVLALAG